jgi:hypothetical protein
MAWKYRISTGELYSPDGNLIGIGYAGGNCGKNPEGINNVDMQECKSIGPLPVGLYTFGTPVEHSHLGAFAIPLIPDPANEMHGRSAFYMHGDVVGAPRTASEGCIIMPPTARHACHASKDQQLQVVV